MAVYANSLAAPLLFDDGPAIAQNPTIRQLWPLSGALAPPATGAGVSGRPLVNLSLAVNYALSGEKVWSYHALNLLVHLAAGLTLFGVVRRTLAAKSTGDPRALPAPPEARSAALLIALLWIVHPLQTETVTGIIQRTEALMGLFYLLTLYCFIRGAGLESGRRGWFALSFLACLSGMATKEVMVSAPLVVLLYDRVFLARDWREVWRRRRGPHLAQAATWLLLAALVARMGGTRAPAWPGSAREFPGGAMP